MMMKDQIENLRGHRVEIIANGILYKGILMGASEESISLQTLQQWIDIPMEHVSSLCRSEI